MTEYVDIALSDLVILYKSDNFMKISSLKKKLKRNLVTFEKKLKRNFTLLKKK